MKRKYLFPVSLFTLLVLAITGCQPAPPTLSIDNIFTQSAQTVQAIQTQAFTSTPMPVVASPTPTLALPSPTSIPTNTQVSPTSTQVSYCDWVSFVKDVNIPDGTFVEENKTFTKTWRLKNRGNCTWTTSYALVFSKGDQMGGPASIALPHEVKPGQVVDISIPLTAPKPAGNYRGYWMLRNSSGVLFGYGDQANQSFFVDVRTGPGNSVGFVSGKVCFPSEHIPPMTLFFQRTSDNRITSAYVHENQSQYQLQLEPGNYLAYAWLDEFTLGGAYTYSMQNDHRLKPFTIVSNGDTKNIDLCDWYGGPGSVPLPPFVQGGKISGNLSYPSEFIPPLRIVAFNTTNGSYQWIDTARNQKTFQFEYLTPGKYQVVAYFKEAGSAAGYTPGRYCQLDQPCDHTLIPIDVKINSHITGVDPIDWYAPIGTFPVDPTS